MPDPRRRVQPIGIDANRYCVIIYDDGSRPCTNSDQCRGDCMADQVIPTGTPGVQSYCVGHGFMARIPTLPQRRRHLCRVHASIEARNHAFFRHFSGIVSQAAHSGVTPSQTGTSRIDCPVLSIAEDKSYPDLS